MHSMPVIVLFILTLNQVLGSRLSMGGADFLNPSPNNNNNNPINTLNTGNNNLMGGTGSATGNQDRPSVMDYEERLFKDPGYGALAARFAALNSLRSRLAFMVDPMGSEVDGAMDPVAGASGSGSGSATGSGGMLPPSSSSQGIQGSMKKRAFDCIKKCIVEGGLHPSQCHSIC